VSSSRNLAALGAFSLLAISATPAAATIPLDGSLSLEVFTKANGNVHADPFDLKSWSNIGPHKDGPRDLGHIAFDPEARTPNGKIDVKGHGDLFAHWDSADQGHVTADIGRTIDLQNDAPQMSLLINSGWDYLFTADQDGVFNLDYMFSGDGQLKGLGDWTFEIKSGVDTRHIDQFEDVTLARVFDGDARRLSFALEAGRTYTVSLFGGDQNRPADGRNLDGGYQARFDWSIASAPEPSTWALTLVGFGLVGAALRSGHARGAAKRVQPLA